MKEKIQRANMQDALKFIALIIMMIDHWGLYLDPYNQLLRTIGRFAFPIFAFYTGYNFHGKMRHIIWILGAILIAVHMYYLEAFVSNILMTLALGQLYLLYAGKAILANDGVFLRHFLAMLILTPATYLFIDYGTLGIAIMMVGYRIKNLKKDEGYLVLTTLCAMIFNEYTMSEAFHSLPYAVAGLAVIALSGLSLKYINHDNLITINLRPITRNMLYIYFVSIVGFIFMLQNNILKTIGS